MRQIIRCGGLFFTALIISTLVYAAPDYVTAWPRSVHLEKPDPVLGNKVYTEHWVYGEEFAKRFKGFPLENADPELDGKLKAMAFRVFKKNFWQTLNSRYPEQYACEIDVYFDSLLGIPSSSGKVRHIFPDYPLGIKPSFRRLEPYAKSDQEALLASKPLAANLARQPLIFSTPLDGRFSTFGVREYHPKLVPELSVITLLSGDECSVSAPLQKRGAHWLSLFGERPWETTEDDSPKAIQGRYSESMALVFEVGTNPASKGYFRVPQEFNKAALPKATLIKVLNWCIPKRHYHANPIGKPMTEEHWQPIADRCEAAEKWGEISPNPQYHYGKTGLQEQGF